ncbi:hypothetical protein GDO81_028264 [Engystomops pustulosus]|uniref:Uncharacterized protein n=1 Tax=Engystomops pustulosus TaxID=76066 RepID=A0AAV6YHF5_ENGPU|nr:hypothetical protein GDO81_028264 [Engystomops pustulosus]
MRVEGRRIKPFTDAQRSWGEAAIIQVQKKDFSRFIGGKTLDRRILQTLEICTKTEKEECLSSQLRSGDNCIQSRQCSVSFTAWTPD